MQVEKESRDINQTHISLYLANSKFREKANIKYNKCTKYFHKFAVKKFVANEHFDCFIKCFHCKKTLHYNENHAFKKAIYMCEREGCEEYICKTCLKNVAYSVFYLGSGIFKHKYRKVNTIVFDN